MKVRFLSGFALPTVLIASVIMLTVLLASVVSVSTISSSISTQYNERLAQSASDAGLTYAKACLAANGNVPKWSNVSPLKPNTDCSGVQLAGFTCPDGSADSRCYVYYSSSVFSTFSVGLPELDTNGKAIDINVSGSTKLLKTSDGSVWRTYNQNSSSHLSLPVATVYSWGGGGAGGTLGGWVYGAAGGAGGAAQGVVSFSFDTDYSVVVGGGGGVNSYSAGALTCVNGGGACASWNNSDNRYGSGGGGYSGIFSTTTISQATALLIAGGGGGGGSSRAGTGNAGGAGGGAVGQDGYSPYDGKVAYAGKGGTQSAAGADASCTSPNTTGGQGALQGGRSKINSYGGAGGGGYWGGSGGGYSESNTMGGGGGGSSYYNPVSVSSAVLSTGSGINPGDMSNPYRGSAGDAGIVAGAGAAGKVVVVYKTANYKTVTITGGISTVSGDETIVTFFGNGTIKFPSGDWTGSLSKVLTFDSASDLTSNFTQNLSAGATQTVSGGYVTFAPQAGSPNDQTNNLVTNFLAGKKISYFKWVSSYWAWSSATNYHLPSFDVSVVDSGGSVITTFILRITFAYLYSTETALYNTTGKISWCLTSNCSSTSGNIVQLGNVPDRVQGNYHTYELTSLDNGTYQFKLDGSNLGSPINLGNSNYRLGGNMNYHPMSAWWNVYTGSYLNHFEINYY